MEMKIETRCWPIAGAFTISRGSKTQAEVVEVHLTHQGFTGVGECVPYARYGESVAQVMADLQAVAPLIEEAATQSAIQKTMQQKIQQVLPPGAARNALDCAWWDLHCKYLGNTIWQQLSLKPQSQTTAFTLSLASPEEMGKSANLNQDRPLLKLKLAGEGDIERVAAVRQNAPNSKIIVDANEGWDIDRYLELVPQLLDLNVSMIEQPFPSDCDHWLDGLERPITICADESCHGIDSLDHLVGRYDMINIKLDKTGGLTQALALKQGAMDKGFQIMVGCMVGSSLGMAPAFVVAQGADIVDLDGPLLLSEDHQNGFEFDGSTMQVMSPALWG